MTDAAQGTKQATTYSGQRILRKEDVPLLTGKARFVEDLQLPRMLQAEILRSDVAHAQLRRIDTTKAEAMPGVEAVLTGADLVDKLEPWGHQTQGLPQGERFPFAVDKILYEGQELAAVAAESRYAALDALEAIEVEVDELQPVVGLEDAIREDAPLVREDIEYEKGRGNVFDVWRSRIGDIGRAEEEADVVVRHRFDSTRTHGTPVERHGCVADYDTASGQLTLYTATQSVYLVRDLLALSLKIPANRIRVVALEVGAGFGNKVELFQHEVIAAVLSMRLGRPVKIILSRADVLRATTARANQARWAELFVKKTGEIVGFRDRILHNAGAGSMWGNQTLSLGTHVGLAPYPIPNVHIDGYALHTNSCSAGALRGFGNPQLLWATEQLIDEAAEAVGMDPIELRLKNVIADDQCPYTNPMGHVIDSTSLRECVQQAAQEIGWDQYRNDDTPYEGVGLALIMKYTSARHPSVDTDLSSARIRVDTDGTVTVYSSDVPHGQGHQTMLSQLVADGLGVRFDDVRVVSSDTESSNYGLGTWGSRAASILGAACHIASERVWEKVSELAGHLLEVSPEDLQAQDGIVSVRGIPEKAISYADLAGIAAMATHHLPPGFEGGSIEGVATYDTPTELLTESGGNITPTYSGGAHAARVRVDPGTGRIEVLDYVLVHDSGTVINPLIVEGQHQGSFLHGYAHVCGEGLVYDDHGRMVTASFADYQAPYAPDVPNLKKVYSQPAPSRVLPGGRKGAGETGTGPVAPTIANAVYNATGVRFTEMPMTPDRLLRALKAKESAGVNRFLFPDDMPGQEERRSFTPPKVEEEAVTT